MLGRDEDVALIHRLVAHVPTLEPLLEQHIAANDEVLPYVFLPDVARFVTAALADDGPTQRDARRAVDFLDQAFGTGEGTDDLISLGFVEALEATDPGYEQVRQAMGPGLRLELARYESG